MIIASCYLVSGPLAALALAVAELALEYLERGSHLLPAPTALQLRPQHPLNALAE